ncbi:Uncharacterised protein [Lysinibacillus capsici]|uniref:Uncharacterized protein n=1 Tax=Lysinibacillus capsici TaxID=2115968 RepID=A0A2X0XHD3_9BACI|nr:Uncharacterised protein [Lysinibacillus capsici]
MKIFLRIRRYSSGYQMNLQYLYNSNALFLLPSIIFRVLICTNKSPLQKNSHLQQGFICTHKNKYSWITLYFVNELYITAM